MMYALYRIVIAQDEALLAALLARLILRTYPTVVVHTFANGQTALDDYDHYGATLLLVNHGMPGMDGPTLIRTLRARGDTVPIIGMSGDPYYRRESLEAGAMAFVESFELSRALPGLLERFLPAQLHTAWCPTKPRKGVLPLFN